MDQMTQFKYYLYLDKFGTWNGRYLILEKKKLNPLRLKQYFWLKIIPKRIMEIRIFSPVAGFQSLQRDALKVAQNSLQLFVRIIF